MNLPVRIHEAAEAEINEAADFYDLAAPGLGTTLLNEIENTLEVISRYPQVAPLARGNVRKKALPNFPYSLLYAVRPNEIRLLAVAHQKRRPFYWRCRR